MSHYRLGVKLVILDIYFKEKITVIERELALAHTIVVANFFKLAFHELLIC